jgi:hypothetical protein
MKNTSSPAYWANATAHQSFGTMSRYTSQGRCGTKHHRNLPHQPLPWCTALTGQEMRLSDYCWLVANSALNASRTPVPSRISKERCARRILVPFCLLTIFLLPSCYRGSHPSHVGELAPDFTVQDSDRKVTLSQFRGQVVVLNFWATWCPPCVDELPSMINMQRRMRDKG